MIFDGDRRCGLKNPSRSDTIRTVHKNVESYKIARCAMEIKRDEYLDEVKAVMGNGLV